MENANKKLPPKVQGLTGHEVLSAIHGCSKRWVTKVLTGNAHDKKDFAGEMERYKVYQRAYIARRRHELGIKE